MARLVYSSDESPGIRRKGAGRGFYYLYPDGNKVDLAPELERIRSLAIPPAYQEVWICLKENGHLQATGRDDRQRKQYRYHPEWQRIRNLTKFSRLAELGHALPRLRRKVRRDLSDFRPDKAHVAAAAVRLLDRAGMRVGNETYLRENRTRGVSTLAKKNVDLDGDGGVDLHFTGKGGAKVEFQLHDGLLEQALQECHDLPGRRLFSYRDDAGEVHDIDSEDVNDYLRSVCGDDFSAKDLRTWRASALAVEFLLRADAEADRETTARDAVRYAADGIRNRYATCRKFYVHPAVITAWQENGASRFANRSSPAETRELTASERVLLELLEEAGG